MRDPLRLPPREIAEWADKSVGEAREAQRLIYETLDEEAIDERMAFALGRAYEAMKRAEQLADACRSRANHFARAEREAIAVFSEAANFVGRSGLGGAQ